MLVLSCGRRLAVPVHTSAGHPSMEGTSFVVTVVDEAAQCAEPSLLIALRRGCTQCIMVQMNPRS